MGLFQDGLQIVTTTLRNELRLKPIARKAARDVRRFLKARAATYGGVEVWLGLAEPEQLRCLVFVADEATKAHYESNGYVRAMSDLFRQALASLGYPAQALPGVRLDMHSEEAIRRAGGDHRHVS
jgi:hypothetical protein